MVHKATLLLSLVFSVRYALASSNREDFSLHSREEKAASQLIVRLKEGAALDPLQKSMPIIASWDILPGFMVNKADVDVNALRANPNVLTVKENRLLNFRSHATITQDDAPWGLGRLSVRESSDLHSLDPSDVDFDFEYKTQAGQGVDIYIVDGGVRITHKEFGNRARWGWWGNFTQTDPDGHGTHLAVAAAGTRLGVAKAANIIAVKPLSDAGETSTDIITRLYPRSLATSKRPGVVNMALGTPASTDGIEDIEDALKNLVTAGIHVVVSAGNESQDASLQSPARLDEVITVGASNITDKRASLSNYGPSVDIYAPGQDIISAHHTSDSAVATRSGTSPASGYVSGLVAYLISTEGQRTPKKMKDLLTDGLWSYSVPQIDQSSIPSGKRLIAQIKECGLSCYAKYWF